MSYWRDLAGVAKGVALVNRAFWREQARIIDQRWSVGTGQEVIEKTVRSAAEFATNVTKHQNIQANIKDTVDRAQTLAEGLRQGASLVFSRPRTVESLREDEISREASSMGPAVGQIVEEPTPSKSLIDDIPKERLDEIRIKSGIAFEPPMKSNELGSDELRPKSATIADAAIQRAKKPVPKETLTSDIPPQRLDEIKLKSGIAFERPDAKAVDVGVRKRLDETKLKSGVKPRSTPSQKMMNIQSKDVLLTPPSAIGGEIASQKLSETSKERRVPSTRIGRAATFANLAVGLAAGTVAEMTRKSLGLSQSNRSGLFDSNPILSEANAERIVNTLCRVRGAALKLGQMLSIQDNTMISPQIQRIFERVRFSADFMPRKQVDKTLTNELGSDWREKFATFDERPFAAASIGQVHKGTLKNGMEVAVKIQYPGVAQSIDSDINNLVSVLSIGNILPRGLYLENFVKVAKTELAQECDYFLEAQSMRRMKTLLTNDKDYHIPNVIDELTTQRVLCTELIYGIPVDKCVDLDQTTRDWIGAKLLDLCLRELFEFNFMQTDPNWSNFFYNSKSRQAILLDFGAAREYGKKFVHTYMQIVKASASRDNEAILRHLKDIGFVTGYESKVAQKAHCDAVLIVGEPFTSDDLVFDFGNQDITPRIQRLIPIMIENRLTPPPEEMYSLHRKLSGTFLLCNKLKSRIQCKPLFDRACKDFHWNESMK